MEKLKIGDRVMVNPEKKYRVMGETEDIGTLESFSFCGRIAYVRLDKSINVIHFYYTDDLILYEEPEINYDDLPKLEIKNEDMIFI